MDDGQLAALDLLLRGGACVLLLLVAGLLTRDHRGAAPARLGALFAAGAAAYAICSTPGLHRQLGWWSSPLVALASGNNLVFWLFARALFDDGFRPRARHAWAWAAIVALALLSLFVLPPQSAAARAVGVALGLQAIGFALLAGAQTLASWPADLVDARRRLRVFIVAAAIAHTLVSVIAQLVRGRAEPPAALALGETAALALAAGVTAWSLLQVAAGDALFGLRASDAGRARPTPAILPLDRRDRALAAALERAMTVERAYRLDGLTIGRLAQSVGEPEHRLRRLINQHLGWRNFNAFLNSYRLAEIKAALADPAQVETSILTMALDAGFASLGPFNRAFKAETGQTPTAFRRAALAEADLSPTASRISKSA